MSFAFRTSLTAALLLVGSSSASAQNCEMNVNNLVANCSFETGPSTSGPTYQFLTELPGWNVSGGQFERWTNDFNTFRSQQGVAHLELDSDLGNTTIWQNLTTTVGARYDVSFWAGHRSKNGQSSLLGVQVNDLTIFTTPAMTDVDPGQYQWVRYTTSFTATSASTKFGFVGAGPSNTYGDHLDNIAVVSTVPEPSTYALMAAGLAGMFGFARRRRQTA